MGTDTLRIEELKIDANWQNRYHAMYKNGMFRR